MVMKYVTKHKLFSIIEGSKSYFDLRSFNTMMMQEVACRRDEGFIIKFLISQNIPVKSIHKDVDINKYKD